MFLAVGVGAGALVPSGAWAAEQVRCEGTATGHFEPGLSFTQPRDTHFMGHHEYTSCESADGSVKVVTLYEDTFLVDALCTVAPSPTTATLVWPDETSSLLSLNGVEMDFDFDKLRHILITAGFVTSGHYAGSRVRYVTVFPLVDQLVGCALPWGLVLQRGTTTLTIEDP